MADDQSVAPKERVNITYKPAIGERQGRGRAAAEDAHARRLHAAGRIRVRSRTASRSTSTRTTSRRCCASRSSRSTSPCQNVLVEDDDARAER